MGTRAPKPGRTRLGKGAGPVHNLAPAKIGARRRQPGQAPASSQTRMWNAFPSPARRPTKLHADPRVSKHSAEQIYRAEVRAPLPSPCSPLPSPPPPPQPPGPGQPRAGRGGGGAGCRAAPAQKAESRSGEARAVSAVQTALPRNPAGIQTRRSPSSPPGLARPRAMEFLWASLLGLCCSLAAANRHTVFWNSSNPK